MFQDFANQIFNGKLFRRPTFLHNQGQVSSDHPLLEKLSAAPLTLPILCVKRVFLFPGLALLESQSSVFHDVPFTGGNINS